MRCFYHPDYYFPLPEAHPFPMDKYWRTEALLRAECPTARIERVAPASWEQVFRVHSQDYVESIVEARLPAADVVRLGLPPCERIMTRARLGAAGTLAAMQAALEEGLAANLAGGTHHAFPARGLGYCVLNDVAIAIRELHSLRPGARVFVIDTDAHQGNGTNAIFAGDARVFTYSIHVGRNYPAEKVPGSLDIELPRYVGGDAYLVELGRSLPESFDRFAPDFAFWLSGADPHVNDRFGQMQLSDDDLIQRDRLVLDLVASRGTPCVALLAGGYNRDRSHTARLHANSLLSAAACHARRRAAAGTPADGAAA